MRERIFPLTVILAGFALSFQVFAFEKNPPKTMKSSFIGDISNSMADETYGREDLHKKTDSAFVGANTITTDYNADFYGDSYQQQVGNGTLAPFAGDGTFVGKNYGK